MPEACEKNRDLYVCTGCNTFDESKPIDLTIMARQESDKEDLISEATALVDRAEYLRAAETDSKCSWKLVTVGFRKDRSFSIYFDQDPFYQFDSNGSLPRASENGFLYRSQHTTLARLKRERSDNQTTLQRTDLDATQLAAFQERLMSHLCEFHKALRSSKAQRQRAVTTMENIDQRTLEFLETVLRKEQPFLSPTINMRT